MVYTVGEVAKILGVAPSTIRYYDKMCIRDRIYGLDVSDSTISRITDKILPIAKEWRERPLEEMYAVIFIDDIH